MTKPDPAHFVDLLQGKPAEIGRLALMLRELVLELLPDTVMETVDGADAGYGLTAGYRGLMCVITPQRDHVTLGLADGAGLADPAGLLQGRGRRHRHLRITSREQLDDPELAALIAGCRDRVLDQASR